jgi:hypothetical protein
MLERPPSEAERLKRRARERRSEARRAQHAAAQRRYRQREAVGDLIVSHPFTVAEVAKLCALGYLRDCELENRAAINAAIGALIANIKFDDG